MASFMICWHLGDGWMANQMEEGQWVGKYEQIQGGGSSMMRNDGRWGSVQDIQRFDDMKFEQPLLRDKAVRH